MSLFRRLRATLYELTTYFWARELFAEKKKKEKKIVQTNVRARQSALNNELDSQELVTHARNYD